MIFDRNLIQHNRDGLTVDEIIISGCTFHLQQMSNGHYWIGITRPGVDDTDLHVHLATKRSAAILCTVQDENWNWDEKRVFAIEDEDDYTAG